MGQSSRLPEFQAGERPRLVARLRRLASQCANPDVDPLVAGWLDLHDGIWWLALYGDLLGAKPFLQAADHQLSRHVAAFSAQPASPDEAYALFSSHLGLFFSRVLCQRQPDEIGLFDKALGFLASCLVQPDDSSPGRRSPALVLVCGLAALSALWRRRVPPLLPEACRATDVASEFSLLHAAVQGVIENPVRVQCDRMLAVYRSTFSVDYYRAGLVRGLQLHTLLVLSVVGHGGDVLAGATGMFSPLPPAL